MNLPGPGSGSCHLLPGPVPGPAWTSVEPSRSSVRAPSPPSTRRPPGSSSCLRSNREIRAHLLRPCLRPRLWPIPCRRPPRSRVVCRERSFAPPGAAVGSSLTRASLRLEPPRLGARAPLPGGGTRAAACRVLDPPAWLRRKILLPGSPHCECMAAEEVVHGVARPLRCWGCRVTAPPINTIVGAVS